MGIPRLFNYLKERYPSLCETIKANQIPHYDHFYVDMNFLIHKLVSETHPTRAKQSDDRFFSESEIFERVLCSIESLFRLIQPTTLFFLSIDGVAPRAKWNKQRQRRFRLAKNGNKKVSELAATTFDSNCITPGTEFMERLEMVLSDFIADKMKNDPTWQRCSIVLSGPGCPGEGSIKIVEYLRYLKSSEDNSNYNTHCIYSGDSDFLMLGLSSHEFRISLLQEIVHMQRSNGFPLTPIYENDIKHEFSIMHFEILREYLEMEFCSCKHQMNFEYDLDKIADDWVLLCMLIGNDYLPNLPNFNVNENVLPLMYDAYKDVLPKLNGYMNESGSLNVKRFQAFIDVLKLKDFQLCQDEINKSHQSLDNHLKQMDLNKNPNSSDNCNELTTTTTTTPPTKTTQHPIDFIKIKEQYYKIKFPMDSEPNLSEVTKQYIIGIQWTLFYYYRGIPSWDYYYPYNYAPYLSDLTSFDGINFSFDLDQPVLPLQHLLAILPSNSCQLLPECYRSLVNSVPLNTFYPTEFDCDANGKSTEWESITLLPFIDKSLLLTAAVECENRLTLKEKQRNQSQPIVCYKCMETDKSNMLQISLIHREKIVAKNRFTTSVNRPNVTKGIISPFSALKYHKNTAMLMDSHSRSKQILLIKLDNEFDQTDDLDAIAEQYLNRNVFVNWPHCHEAKIVEVFNASTMHRSSDAAGDQKHIKLPTPENVFQNTVEHLRNMNARRGLDVGEIKIVANVIPLKCVEYKPSTKFCNELVLENSWDQDSCLPVAIQALITNATLDKPSVLPPVKHVKNALKKTTMAFIVGNSLRYGQKAIVADITNLESNGRVYIYAHIDDDPDLHLTKEIHVKNSPSNATNYKQLTTAASLIAINPTIFARITGSVFVLMAKRDEPIAEDKVRKVNVGLQLKSRKQPGMLTDYVKLIATNWTYSQKTVDLVAEYLQQFPRIFQVLSSTIATNEIYTSDFGVNNRDDGTDYVNEVKQWLAKQPQFKCDRQRMGAMQLADDAIDELIKALDTIKDKSESNVLKLQMKWQNLYVPELNNIFVIPEPMAIYKLLDRVVIARNGYAVPIGAKGTVIAIQSKNDDDLTEDTLHLMEIFMDEPYYRASSSCKFDEHRIFRTRSTTMLINISYGKSLV